MEELRRRHGQEQRDLQARITSKKKNATKKTRKGILDECTRLEYDLQQRQVAEVAQLADPKGEEPLDSEDVLSHANGNADTGSAKNENTLEDSGISEETSNVAGPNVDTLASKVANLSMQASGTPSTETMVAPSHRPAKPNRQKARLARRAAAQEAAAAEAASEAADLPDARAVERVAMQRHCATHGLVEHEVRSDGHCLFAAVADQLSQQQRTTAWPKDPNVDPSTVAESSNVSSHDQSTVPPYLQVRQAAAGLMKAYPDDFAPFLDDDQTLDSYIQTMRDTAAWGGQLELVALARAYEVPIHVLQGDGRIEKIEAPESATTKVEAPPLWLSYHRHAFGLGEHYNSLRKAQQKQGS